MADQETGKFRAARIPLDYYKQPDTLGRWKRRLVVLALVVVAGSLVAATLRRDRGARLVSRGPVATAHASWDSNCEACHSPFRPLSEEVWLAPLIPPPHHTGPSACASCHDGPAHHAAERRDDRVRCAGCHREHRGRDASLILVPDSDCSRCHANLSAHIDSQKSPTDPGCPNAATHFDRDRHPEFRLPAQDPGKLKFSHKVHMAEGMDSDFTLADIDPSARSWYAQHQEKRTDKDRVQLQCEACHRLDRLDLPGCDGEPGGPMLRRLVPPGPDSEPGGPLQRRLVPLRTDGAYLLPISYDGQCAACHPLTIERRNPDDPRSGWRSVPHGLQPPELHELLKGYDLWEVPKVSAAERLLYSQNGCFECHEGQGTLREGVPGAIVPTNVPAVWFKHARFDHLAHRAVKCQECHIRAAASTVSTDVLIPGRDNCLQCHTGSAGGGARNDCAECHRYHNGDNPLQGLGAADRGVAGKYRLDIPGFLRKGQ